MLGGGLLNKRNSLKLQKFKENNSKRKVLVIVIILSVFLLSGIYLYNSFAVFSEEKHFNIINGTIGDPGDIYFAYYVDNNITRDLPAQGSGYTLDIEKSNCTNGVTVNWDENTYSAIITYSKYNAKDYTRTRCNLYFEKSEVSAIDFIKKLSKYNIETLVRDEVGGNIRYIGANPDNYVNIDGELWRIIGVMNNIDDGTGNKSDRIKLIKNESIGSYSWDSSDSTVNSGLGVNEWSQSDLMKLLNPGYESETVGGSLYWNSWSGNCYNGKNNATTACDFTNSGLKENLKGLIDDVVWNTGSNGSDLLFNEIVTSKFYELERSSNNGKICSSGSWCNDTVERTTTWKGTVGLMYPSDYGYATSGGSPIDRTTCLNTKLGHWDSSTVRTCYLNDWLYKNGSIWQITPAANASIYYEYGNGVFCIAESSAMGDQFTALSFNVFPVVYISSSAKITSGIGSKESPFILGL